MCQAVFLRPGPGIRGMQNIVALVTFPFEVLRGRTGKWDVAKDAVKERGPGRPTARGRPGFHAAVHRCGGRLLSRVDPVRLMPAPRGNGPDPPYLSTMRYGTGRLRYVALGYEPARHRAFTSRAGEDAVRSRLSSYCWSSIAPEMPKAPAR
jgi:hypothetical protein